MSPPAEATANSRDRMYGFEVDRLLPGGALSQALSGRHTVTSTAVDKTTFSPPAGC